MYAILDRLEEYSANPMGLACLLTGLVLAAIVFFLLVVPIHNVVKYRVVIRCGDTEMAECEYNRFLPFTNYSTIGFVSTIVFGFGFGRPVYFDSQNFRRPRFHTCLVSFSGLLVYFVFYLVSLVLFFLLEFGGLFSITSQYDLPEGCAWYVYVYYIFFTAVAFFRRYCIFSFVFNLIPFGPLDMSEILYMFLPVNWSDALRNNQTITSCMLFLLAFFSIGKPSGLITRCANNIHSIFSNVLINLFGGG